MSKHIGIRDVTVELLRSGPSHNQLLSPLTLYLGICDEAEAGIVTLPFEHHTFLRRMAALRYDAEAKGADKHPELAAMGVELAKVLGAIPRLPGSLSGETTGRDTLVHLRLVLSASELALLPFELAKMPIGPTTWTESWLALQSRVPVVITRRTRNVAAREFHWLHEPRVLFIGANPDPNAPDNVPFAEHRQALIAAVRPFLMPEDRDRETSANGRREQFGDKLTILRQPRFSEVVAECARHRYTHIHVLAHGATDATLGDKTFGLKLHPADGVISGERLASAFTCMVDGRIHRPDVVSLATCDSANLAEAITQPGASIAHVLHQAGVPLVLASQFPLSKAGSVLVVREFYCGLLWGEDPWVLLHRVRTGLHGTVPPGRHDWASLVVYEALDLDTYKLDQARYNQCHRAMLAAWMDDDGVEDELCDVDSDEAASMAGAWKADVVIERLPVDSKYFGMRALALRADGRLQNAIDTLHEVDTRLQREDPDAEYDSRIGTSCRELEDAIDDYEASVTGFLVKDGQGMNAPYRSLVALLRLRTVLGRPSPAGAWETAYFWVHTTLRELNDADERAWGWACLAELWLLRLLHDEPFQRRDADQQARLAAAELVRHDRVGHSLARGWLLRQLDTYIGFWGDERFEAAMRRFGEKGRCTFLEGEDNLMRTAVALCEILDKQGTRQRAQPAAPVLPPPKALAKAKPATLARSAGAQSGLLGNTGAAPDAQAASRADTLFHIDMLPARHGDALWLEYGPRAAAQPHRMLIDCGPAGTYRLLKQRIEALPREQRHFELFILSHIDDDHIGGAIKLLKDAKGLGLSFGDIWFNGWRHIGDLMNARQGEEFSELIEAQGLPWNRAVGGARIVREEDELPTFTLPSGMKLSLLSPTPARLAALARSWDKEMKQRAAEAEAEVKADRGDELMADVPDGGWSDDVPALAAEPFDSDTTAPNGSSIAVLAEYGGRRVLLGADAYAPVLQQAVQLMQQQDPRLNPLPLSAFKLPHHGSRNNLSRELLALLRCEHYLVSTSGARFKHPDRQAIARVIEHGRASGLPATLWFNCRAPEPLNGVWDRADLKARYGYRTVYPAAGEPVLRFSPA